MSDNNLLTGTVMLETMWETKRHDLLDLISPFVFYATAKVCSIGEQIDLERILAYIKKEFGYVDMPITIIERVYKRNTKYFKRDNGKYYLKSNLDEVFSIIEKRRDECEEKIRHIGKQLAEYLEIKGGKSVNEDYAMKELQGFFSRQGMFLGTNQLEEHEDEIINRKVDYYIAQYIYEKRDKSEIEFDYIIDLVKGYFLKAAIYLQAENGNIITSTYRNVSFYYDTPFLLRLLGFKTAEDEKSSNELHQTLTKQKGNFFYFPQTQSEIEGVLNAYKRNLGKFTSYYTLEGLDEKRYTFSSVERLQKTWESKLHSIYDTKLAPRPEYRYKANGTIDEKYVIDEAELAEVLKAKINWHTEEAMNADIESILGIHKLRGDIFSGEIENCKAVFVTTNTKLAQVANKYYKEHVNDKTFPLVITDADLAALTWIKRGSIGDLPERLLLRNAYMALQPTPELLEKFGNILEQMQMEGKINSDIAIVLRSSGFAKKELFNASLENEDMVSENLVVEIEAKLREENSAAAREDEKQKAERQKQQEDHERIANAYRMARYKAAEARNKQINRDKIILRGMGIFFLVVAFIGTIYSYYNSNIGSIVLTVIMFISAVFSVLGIIDTYKERERYLYGWIVRRGNEKYDKAYNELCKEYSRIAKGEKQ